MSVLSKKNAGLGPAGGPKPKNFAAKNKKRGAHGLKKTILFCNFYKIFYSITQILSVRYNISTLKTKIIM